MRECRRIVRAITLAERLVRRDVSARASREVPTNAPPAGRAESPSERTGLATTRRSFLCAKHSLHSVRRDVMEHVLGAHWQAGVAHGSVGEFVSVGAAGSAPDPGDAAAHRRTEISLPRDGVHTRLRPPRAENMGPRGEETSELPRRKPPPIGPSDGHSSLSERGYADGRSPCEAGQAATTWITQII